ncbi:hypothetical protein ANANG_G00264280 [Anguilla anguilla]|uniref:Rab9 effector protein with kelch motifs n=1 Tax=Anguilla anguilla TaxID=7936 RepID=A0A9D3LTY3_ANGAN|nr:hypothetical protein ANANG_G00264280 [Anguilla anguilla]
MEFLPILEPEDKPRDSIWYAVVPRGGGPGVSVGHTCTYVSGKDAGKGKILIVGGANPNGSFSESHVLNLDRHEWDVPEWGACWREHCTSTAAVGVWRAPPAACGCLPGPIRAATATATYHTSSACVGDRLFVFSGGDAGAAPVSDLQLHVFDSVSLTWHQPETQGRPPSPRHGHMVAAVGSRLYVHGGLAGEKFHSDMHCLALEHRDDEVGAGSSQGRRPPGVASHAAATLGKSVYVFGGLTADGATNSTYRFHTDRQRWTLLKFEGDLPANRLDHSMCVVPWRVRTEGRGVGDQVSEPETVHLCFVFGGMDTHGVIHSDCVATVLP